MTQRKQLTREAVASILPAIGGSRNRYVHVTGGASVRHYVLGGAPPPDLAEQLGNAVARRRVEAEDAIATAQARLKQLDAIEAAYELAPSLTPAAIRSHYQYRGPAV